MVGVNKKTKTRTEREPPEGGFGYFVAFGLAISQAVVFGHLNSFGLLYNDFLVSVDAGSSAVTLIVGLCTCAMSFAAMTVGILLKKCSFRTIGMMGAIMYTLGCFLSIFATSVEHLIVSFGIFQGIGIGLMYNVTHANFNRYFVKRRVFVFCAAQVIKGAFITIYPFLAQFLLVNFTYRGALTIISAVHSHVIFAMMLMHPVEWHLKRIKRPTEEIEPLTETSDIEDNVKIIKIQDVEKNVEKILEKNQSIHLNKSYDELNPLSTRIASIMSLNSMGGLPVENGKWRKLVDFFDLTLLKDVVYINIALGVSFAVFSDTTFCTLFPMYLFELGFSKGNTAFIISVSAATDFTSRIVLAAVTYFFELKARYILLSGVLATILFRYFILNTHSFMGIVVLMGALGFFRTLIHAPISLIFADHLPPERFASAFGLFIFIQGNLIFLLGPVVGIIRDITNSYVICFHSLSILLCFCSVPWIIEIIYFRSKTIKTIKPLSK